ncbi:MULTISPECIES: hypothetical protein [Streptomyces]|uniref:hypothetical protein n=1 Tax=Streptomyces TaxID=1883 RepID=UPI001BECE84A|nr:hypothetical protein [Streptomyces sp. McG3]MBT2895656.1 hypothetical protein [Streptomyces sp. McG3]
MAITDTRPRAIVLLTDIDASRSDEPDHLFHHDGRPFTTAEYELLSTCTPTEIDIAVAHMQPVGDWMSERQTVQKALIGLYMKYAYQMPDAFPDSVYDLMTEEDYSEFERLADIVSADDAFEEHTGHEQD